MLSRRHAIFEQWRFALCVKPTSGVAKCTIEGLLFTSLRAHLPLARSAKASMISLRIKRSASRSSETKQSFSVRAISNKASQPITGNWMMPVKQSTHQTVHVIHQEPISSVHSSMPEWRASRNSKRSPIVSILASSRPLSLFFSVWTAQETFCKEDSGFLYEDFFRAKFLVKFGSRRNTAKGSQIGFEDVALPSRDDFCDGCVQGETRLNRLGRLLLLEERSTLHTTIETLSFASTVPAALQSDVDNVSSHSNFQREG